MHSRRLTINNYFNAIINDDLDFVRRYLKYHCLQIEMVNPFNLNDNTPEFYKASALYVAAAHGRMGVVNLLLNYGIDIHRGFRPSRHNFFSPPRDEGDSPLYIAAKNGHDSVVAVLLKSGARVNRSLRTGETPLHAACEAGNYSTAELLLYNGADVSASRFDGETALHIAAKQGDFALVKLLLCHGASLSSTGYGLQRSPIQEALEAGHTKIAKHMRRVLDDPTFHPLGYVKV